MNGKTRLRHGWALIAIMCTLLLPIGAQAHGGGAPQLSGAEAGPYRIYAWTSPDPWRVGDAHIDVAVAKPADDGMTEIPVMDADVRVRLIGPDNGSTIELPAQLLTYLNSFYYEVEFELSEPGTYQVEILVTNPEGAGSAGFRIETFPLRAINWLLLVGGVIVLVGASVLWAFWSRQATPPTPGMPTPGPRDQRTVDRVT